MKKLGVQMGEDRSFVKFDSNSGITHGITHTTYNSHNRAKASRKHIVKTKNLDDNWSQSLKELVEANLPHGEGLYLTTESTPTSLKKVRSEIIAAIAAIVVELKSAKADRVTGEKVKELVNAHARNNNVPIVNEQLLKPFEDYRAREYVTVCHLSNP